MDTSVEKRQEGSDEEDNVYDVITPRNKTRHELRLHENTEIWFEEGLVYQGNEDSPNEYTGCCVWSASLVLSRW